MNNDFKTSFAGYVQAAVGVLSAVGVSVSPENAQGITTGALALVGLLGAIKGHFTKDK